MTKDSENSIKIRHVTFDQTNFTNVKFENVQESVTITYISRRVGNCVDSG